jgi:hypothetical protein
MDHFITFRARGDFLRMLRVAAEERGVSVSQTIREAIARKIKPPLRTSGGK